MMDGNNESIALDEPIFTLPPRFSVIVAVYNDWEILDQCLRSLAQQANAPSFEVIIVDDDSQEVAPDSILRWNNSYPLTVLRQTRGNVSVARNRGIQISRGSILIFADADSRFQMDCLAVLSKIIVDSSQHDYFQLHLVGDCSGLVGKAEQLRLITFQEYMLQLDGCIRYLNTAGFAVRRSRVDIDKGLFDPAAVRAEDTFLLANLIHAGKLPLFVANAIVQHSIHLSFGQCLRKDMWSAFLEARVYALIASKGVRIQVSYRDRMMLLWSMWKASAHHSIGRLAWFALVMRQGLRLVIFLFMDFSRIRPNPRLPSISS